MMYNKSLQGTKNPLRVFFAPELRLYSYLFRTMNQGLDQTVTNRLTLERISCSLNKQDLRRLVAILQQRADSAAEIEVANFQQLNQTKDEFEKNKALLRSGFQLRLTVTGYSGQDLYGPADEVFVSPNFPETVKFVYINSATFLTAVHNYAPRNSFEIFFDFSRPEIFDFNLFPSQRTPNETNVKVSGNDATWANGVFHEIQQFLNENRSQASWLHEHSVYDLVLWLLGYPFAFWVCFKFSPFLSASGAGPFLTGALYLYIALLVLVGFRAVFHYARWVFPKVEYKSDKNTSTKHKVFLGVLSVGLVGSILYDGIKALFFG